MDLVKSEQMQFSLNNQLFNLEKSFENMSYLAVDKKVKLYLEIDQKLKPFINSLNADEGRYTQILLNFISNSLKFSLFDGKIVVFVKPIEG